MIKYASGEKLPCHTTGAISSHSLVLLPSQHWRLSRTVHRNGNDCWVLEKLQAYNHLLNRYFCPWEMVLSSFPGAQGPGQGGCTPGKAEVPGPGGVWSPRAGGTSTVRSNHGMEHPAELSTSACVPKGARVGKSFPVSGSLQATNTPLKMRSCGSEHVQSCS